jgi:CheY-like chemotaxis protein
MGFWDRSLLSARSLRRRTVLLSWVSGSLPSKHYIQSNGACSFVAQRLLVKWTINGEFEQNMAKIKTILFAEDDEVLLTAYRRHLKQAGYAVISAHDGLETLKNLSLFTPDLVILDLMMPKFDGAELLQHLYRTPQLAKVAVFILSSKCFIDAEQEYLMKLADRYLIKQDCTPAILLNAIREQFSGRIQAKAASATTNFDAATPSIIRAGLKLSSTN